MKELRLNDGGRALVIVAHPDDETIWMGGALLRFSKIKWTILSLCRASDSDRRPKFFRVCERYGAKGIIADLDDEDKLSFKNTLPVIKKIIKEEVGRARFDYLFTHNANGEYGHPRHKGAYQAIKEMIKDGELSADKVFFFAYDPVGKHKVKVGKNADTNLKLTSDEFKEKKRIVAEMYGYPHDGIDVGYCTDVEGFS
ncbi:hypothetical protein A2303_06525 [Candidatus Falkowbacteria bacterium RIFOXYB2_FULL_47_14]|uniref:GlcNAc-PI de-N-acetylase n=1 Tax=Candidatus Falkowbacteria bacterium RIFOXYA2_FULL_47_19 TaxID=1797994 RepID=A0A1F5SE15_9BACT|nr:MAG: hypothetical protein A2227_04590 [Candidatus Falkowbacteria bacterium RIFOXYA2_FULL_47_19]OGF35678.1 MAG: hypothetical protein A2468_04490 [Candidatus Falkowbacteria bacterium RIFOXYC2_FULL_46_15]OGF43194.1 MAG: hypothetical protein A2303_06525 [Candidatus Falkowbacteria bacterium RIFOXYB2_FULL_47_14]